MKSWMLAAVTLTLNTLGCPPSPKPVPHDADGASLITPASACANIAARGCTIGADPHCASTIVNVVDAGLERVDLECLMRADSKEAVRACAGGVACP